MKNLETAFLLDFQVTVRPVEFVFLKHHQREKSVYYLKSLYQLSSCKLSSLLQIPLKSVDTNKNEKHI